MVVCNLCRKNKTLEEMKPPFRYICFECWQDRVKISYDSFPIDKDLFY
jgi:hypothetical protein